MSKCFEKSKTENNWDLFFYLRIFKQFHSQTWFPLQTAQLCRIADINYGVWGNNEENVVQQRKTYANPTDCFMNLLRKISSFCLASLRSFVKCLPINFKDALRLGAHQTIKLEMDFLHDSKQIRQNASNFRFKQCLIDVITVKKRNFLESRCSQVVNQNISRYIVNDWHINCN